MAQSPASPAPRQSSGSLSSETPSSVSLPSVEPSGAPWSSFHIAVSRRRKAVKHKALACILSFAAIVTLLAICFRAHRMTLSAPKTRRALAAGPPEEGDETDEEESWILESCLDLEEELGMRQAPKSALPQQGTAPGQRFEAWSPFPPQAPRGLDAPTASSMRQILYVEQGSTLPQHQPSQPAPSSPGFISSAPSLADLGLESLELPADRAEEGGEGALSPVPQMSASAQDEQVSPSGPSQGSKRTQAEDTDSTSDGDQPSGKRKQAWGDSAEETVVKRYRSGDQVIQTQTSGEFDSPAGSPQQAPRQVLSPASTGGAAASSWQMASGGPLASPVPYTLREPSAPMPDAAGASTGGTQAPGFVEIDMGSGSVVRIPHPPPAMPANTHPYYRLPPVPSEPIPVSFQEDSFSEGRGCRAISECLSQVRSLLAQPRLTLYDTQQLVFLGEQIVKFLFKMHRHPVEGRSSSSVCHVFGVRFLCMDALVSMVEVLGPAMNPQTWFPSLVASIPTTYESRAINKGAQLTSENDSGTAGGLMTHSFLSTTDSLAAAATTGHHLDTASPSAFLRSSCLQ
ncbi:hypothetical protein Esti_002845 [Eimeria stiedai]